MTDPTEKTDARLARGGGTRDPFLEATDAAARIRERVIAALSGIAPRGTFLKITNVCITDGRIDASAIVIEMRKPS